MPKIIDHDERRREIIDVTKDVILHGGFEAATMRSIASAAGFANGALKHYFPSKESIVAGVFDSVLAEMVQASRTMPADRPAVEQLKDYIELLLPLDEDRIAAGRVLLALWEYSMSDEALAIRYRQHLDDWRAVLLGFFSEARAQGDIRTSTPDEQLAQELMSVTVGANVLSLMFPSGQYIDEYGRYADTFMSRVTGGAG
jgi:AcrR family transcriptional regulator